ncbi:hypothetical protein Dvina_32400 [Dactylosporangium vinaceum]|uniref:Uncharacterized protein n=1 Tax=Dactylosporangium vinaceum TaxID=53362 RepID=A0ABV5MAF0_9ACTN|nr:hypothetical protein [Dactylosporangium vinaceum]UAB92991.1 hypothetical protein Dvina_32400 [Dactylosporangium vinaceum]
MEHLATADGEGAPEERIVGLVRRQIGRWRREPFDLPGELLTGGGDEARLVDELRVDPVQADHHRVDLRDVLRAAARLGEPVDERRVLRRDEELVVPAAEQLGQVLHRLRRAPLHVPVGVAVRGLLDLHPEQQHRSGDRDEPADHDPHDKRPA